LIHPRCVGVVFVFRMRSFLIVAAVAAVAFGAISDLIDLSYDADSNLTNAENLFSYRWSGYAQYNSRIGGVYGWASTSVDAKKASPAAKASADAMVGVGALPSFVTPPFSLLAYGVGEAAVDVDVLKFLGILLSATPKLDAGFEIGAVAMAALGMQEYTPDNEPVGKFTKLYTPLAGCSAEKLTGANDAVNGLTCTFTPVDSSAKVKITYVSAEKAGVLSYGKTPVSPRSYEMIIEVSGFPLSNLKNHVRLNVALFSAAGTGSVEGRTLIIPTITKENVYSAVADKAIVDDHSVSVKVTIKADLADLSVATTTVIKAALGENFNSQIAEIDFPAGARSFVYDPVVGVGANVYDAIPPEKVVPAEESSASAYALSMLVALICVFAYLF